MSSWERSRRIPWSRLEQSSSPVNRETGEPINPDEKREQILRRLARERAAVEAEAMRLNREKKAEGSSSEGGEQKNQQGGNMDEATEAVRRGGNLSANSQPKSWLAHPYSTPELFRHASFGVIMGSLTGSIFGFVDGMKQASESTVLKKASNAAKARFLVQGTTRAGLTFGGFYGGYNCVKYGVRCVADPGDYPEIFVAGALSMGAMMYRPTLRASMPYGGMLIGMDIFHTYMREM